MATGVRDTVTGGDVVTVGVGDDSRIDGTGLDGAGDLS